MRRNALGCHHVLGDSLAHGAHRLDFVIAKVNPLAWHSRFERDMNLRPGRSGSRDWSWGRCRRYQNGPRRWDGNYGRSRSGRSSRCRDHGFDVLLADAPARAGPLYRREVNTVFFGHAAYQRRTVNAPTRRRTRRRGRPVSYRHGSRSRGSWSSCWRWGRRGRCRSSHRRRSLSLRRSRGGRSRSGSRRTCSINHANDGLDRHGLAFSDLDFLQHACRRRRNFRIHFVSRNFKQRLIALDLVAGFLEPLSNRSLENAFAHLGHHDVNGHGLLLWCCSKPKIIAHDVFECFPPNLGFLQFPYPNNAPTPSQR